MNRKEFAWRIVQAAAPVVGQAALDGLLGPLAQRIARALAEWSDEDPPRFGRGLEP